MKSFIVYISCLPQVLCLSYLCGLIYETNPTLSNFVFGVLVFEVVRSTYFAILALPDVRPPFKR